ncbi:maleylpyruvate isomerase family mycothiol-dependent enzyme [Streptomyces sp. BV286]|uniref:maleylpyruvate isomerase family mycothiol-dependent enzyme n=1 Tax=Streptomyces sp. BV286 TaxID=2849672 RepID=UPI001C2E6DFB|nr:maleylpyruvate isomerase family mycothiol-dependent enzyme [Streptomyces sp. BV286]MBV1940619.1 maleylpyruvate isomerase family mycothiol-dependent enzyme [Streptomyces sp. BV286]
MTLLGHDRYCDEVVGQTALLRSHLAGADLTETVPTCPDWTLRELAVHVGEAHRWAEHIVRTGAAKNVPVENVTGVGGPQDSDPAALDAWLAEGAALAAGTFRTAGADAAAWSWAWEHTAGFWARRMAHETLIHRADAAVTAGAAYEVEPDLAADAIDEWLQIVRFAQETYPGKAANELRGAGRSIHLHATDTEPGLDAEWLIEFEDKGIDWRRGHEKATVALRGPLSEVLLAFYRRLPPDGGRLEVLGERELLDFWLERATFG